MGPPTVGDAACPPVHLMVGALTGLCPAGGFLQWDILSIKGRKVQRRNTKLPKHP